MTSSSNIFDRLHDLLKTLPKSDARGVYEPQRITELMLDDERSALTRVHVVFLDDKDPDTAVDSSSPNYKGVGWYCTDETSMISAGPFAQVLDAVFASGKYCGELGSGQVSADPELADFTKVNPAGKPVKPLDRSDCTVAVAPTPAQILEQVTLLKEDPGARAPYCCGRHRAARKAAEAILAARKASTKQDSRATHAEMMKRHRERPLGIRVGPRRLLLQVGEQRNAGVIVAMGRDVECSKFSAHPVDPMVTRTNETGPLFRIGDRVLIGSYAGTNITIDGQNYVVTKVEEVLIVADPGSTVEHPVPAPAPVKPNAVPEPDPNYQTPSI